jgi:hypothetical protein
MYNPTLGRFLSRDPKGYDAGMSLYQAFGGNPAVKLDPMGTDTNDYDLAADAEIVDELNRNHGLGTVVAGAPNATPWFVADSGGVQILQSTYYVPWTRGESESRYILADPPNGKVGPFYFYGSPGNYVYFSPHSNPQNIRMVDTQGSSNGAPVREGNSDWVAAVSYIFALSAGYVKQRVTNSQGFRFARTLEGVSYILDALNTIRNSLSAPRGQQVSTLVGGFSGMAAGWGTGYIIEILASVGETGEVAEGIVALFTPAGILATSALVGMGVGAMVKAGLEANTVGFGEGVGPNVPAGTQLEGSPATYVRPFEGGGVGHPAPTPNFTGQ